MTFTRLIICVVLVIFLMTCLQIVCSQQAQTPQSQIPNISKQYAPSIHLSTEGPITFEEFPASFRLTNQYEEVRGIVFNDVEVVDYSKLFPTPFAHGNKAIERCPGAEVGCDPPFVMTFSKPQRRVKVWFGYSSRIDQADTVTLKILNAQNVLIDQVSKGLPVSPGPVPVADFLELHSKNADIAYATVSLRTTGDSYRSLVLDDIEFDSIPPLPDLTIENLETKFGPDRQLIITAVVKNIGAGISSKPDVEISAPALWKTPVTLPMPSLKPEESAPVLWVTSIPSNIRPGTYHYRMVVNPSEATDDADVTNNVKESSLLISSEKPDLSVRILKSGVDWFQRAFVLVEITNTGNADSGATVVEAASQGRIIGTASVPPLKPQDSFQANIGIEKPSAGHHSFQVVVNPNQAFQETDVRNNSATGTLLISSWPPPGTVPILIVVILICVVGTSTVVYKVAKRKPSDRKRSPSIDPQAPDPTFPSPTFVARPKIDGGRQELTASPRQHIALRLRSRTVINSQRISIKSETPNEGQP